MTRPKRPANTARSGGHPHPAPRAAPHDSSGDARPGNSRPALALWAALAALVLARAALVVVPSMVAWGLNLHRFLTPAGAWLPWGLVLLALLPPVARKLQPLLTRAGDATAHGRLVPWLWAAFAALLVFALPDLCLITGDFLLRRRAVDEARLPELIFPQALPLDVYLHYTLPRELLVGFRVSPGLTACVTGALDAALLAAAAVAFTRALRFSGAAAFAVTAAVVFGGWLALLTGYSKGIAELVLLTVAIAAFGARVIRDDRGHFGLAISTTTMVVLHRSGLVVLPAAFAAWLIGARRHGFSRRSIAAMTLPVVALTVVAPRVIQLIKAYDIAKHVVGPNDIGGPHALDLANVLMLLAPLAACLPVLLVALGRSIPWSLEIVPLLLLVLAEAGLALAVHPMQGVVRDWDVYAPAGIAVAMLTAWLAGEAIRRAPRHAWIALPVALGAAVPSVQWLLHLNDVELGLERIRAVIDEPPRRSTRELAALWDIIGARSTWLKDWNTAADAFAHSAALAPTPRVLEQWGSAEFNRGDLRRARDVYHLLTTRTPDDVYAWRKLATVVTRMNDRSSARTAAEQILRLDPTDRPAREILEYLDTHPEPSPSSNPERTAHE